MNEGARDNVINVSSIQFAEHSCENVVLLNNCTGNQVHVQHVRGDAIPGAVVVIRTPPYKGSAPATVGNKVQVSESLVASQRCYVRIEGVATVDNVVANGRYFGGVAAQPFDRASGDKSNLLIDLTTEKERNK